ncbi:MAG TPA: GFA family protein [Rhizomicrobium sp.]|nr:GFA family protein [Rhizomicrobium sp.]
MAKPKMNWKKGGCHCGAVQIEVLAPDEIEIRSCNCSMCERVGFLHYIVPKSHFRLVSGEDKLTLYEFNTKTAKHLFCSICGVKSFYVPRSHPDGYSVNFRCLNPDDFTSVLTGEFDGKHWEKHVAELGALEDR